MTGYRAAARTWRLRAHPGRPASLICPV